MRRVMVLAVLALAAGWLASSGAAAQKKGPTKAEIKTAMLKTHKGKDAAYTHAEAELKQDSPNWEAITKDAKAFNAMGTLLKDSADYKDRSTYAKSAGEFDAAAKAKDKDAATKAFAGLTKSCASCHYGGAKAMLGKE